MGKEIKILTQKRHVANSMFSLLLVLLFLITGCAANNNGIGRATDNDSSVDKAGIPLAKIVAQNNGQQLLAEYAAVSAATEYLADGYAENILICHDQETEQVVFVETGSDYQRLIMSEQGYYQTADGMQSQLVFLGDQYQTLYLQNKLPYVALAPALTDLLQEETAVQEQVWAAATDAGAAFPDQNNEAEQKDETTAAAAAQYAVSYGEENDYYGLKVTKTAASGAKLIDDYRIQKDSLLIQKVTASEQNDEGTTTEISSKVMQYKQQYEFTVPDFATAMQRAEPRRTVTFITDPGTAAAKEYVVDAPARAFVSPYYADSYGLYADAAGNKPFVSQPADADGKMPDAQIYLIKK